MAVSVPTILSCRRFVSHGRWCDVETAHVIEPDAERDVACMTRLRLGDASSRAMQPLIGTRQMLWTPRLPIIVVRQAFPRDRAWNKVIDSVEPEPAKLDPSAQETSIS